MLGRIFHLTFKPIEKTIIVTFITSRYGQSRENIFNDFGNFARAILGTPGKFYRNAWADYKPYNAKEALVDCSWGNLMVIANNVPHVNTIISEGAKMFSGMEIKHYKGTGKNKKEITDSPIVSFLSNPNPLQTQSDFLYEAYVLICIYGSIYGYSNTPSRIQKDPSALWWLPSDIMKVNLTGTMFDQVSIDGIIESYELMYDIPKKYSPKEIIQIIDGISQNKITAKSKIEAHQIPISNIVAVLKSYNIITTEKGMVGFIASERSDSTGLSIPMTQEERTAFENQYQKNYGLDSRNGHVMITEAALKWVPMTFPVKDLMMFEGIEESFSELCAAYGHYRDIYPSVKGATFENKKQGLINTYQNTMFPLGKKVLNRLASIWELNKKGEYLEPSWEHLPVMQEDEAEKAAALSNNVTAYSKMLADGVISHEQYAELAGVKMDGTGVSVSEKINTENNQFKQDSANKKQQDNGRA